MKLQNFTPENFSNVNEENISNLKTNAYNKMYDGVSIQQEYNDCNKSNDILCNDLNNTLTDERDDLLSLEEEKNQTRIDYETCNAKNQSCKLLYNDLMLKTKEYNDVFNNINYLNAQISNCDDQMQKCKLIDTNIDRIEQKIKDLEKDLAKTKKEMSKNKC